MNGIDMVSRDKASLHQCRYLKIYFVRGLSIVEIRPTHKHAGASVFVLFWQ